MKKIYIHILFLFSFTLKAVVIGSNAIVSRQVLVTFPSSDGDNELRGFAAFENGFTLNGGGSCIFNSVYPVSGNITLNGGTLSLSKDLICQKDATIVNGGIIVGNGYAVKFLVPSIITIPQNTSNPSSVMYITQINTNSVVT